MKKLILAVIFLAFSASLTYAADNQPAPENLPDAELNQDQAKLRIDEFQLSIQNLTATLNQLDADISNLRNELDQTNASLKDCQKTLYDLIGTNADAVDKFRQSLGVLEGKIRNMKSLSNDVLAAKVDEVKALEEEWKQLASSKISILPEFYDRMVTAYNDIQSLYRKPSTKTYTVGTWAENRDCLWNIAGNIENFGDPFLWPKIWQANTSIIRNPDLIFPGQVLVIPQKAPKTTEEMKAERKYWRNKHAAAVRRTAAKSDNADNENSGK